MSRLLLTDPLPGASPSGSPAGIAECYCTYQEFQDGSYECVRSWVSAEEAVLAARHYTTSVGARLGTTRRVWIVDNEDFATFEWRYGEGIVFPTRAEGATFPGAKDEPPRPWLLADNLRNYGGGI